MTIIFQQWRLSSLLGHHGQNGVAVVKNVILVEGSEQDLVTVISQRTQWM